MQTNLIYLDLYLIWCVYLNNNGEVASPEAEKVLRSTLPGKQQPACLLNYFPANDIVPDLPVDHIRLSLPLYHLQKQFITIRKHADSTTNDLFGIQIYKGHFSDWVHLSCRDL